MKQKRIVERPWGRRRNGGWVIERKDLINALKKAEAVQLDKVMVGTRNLIELVKLVPHDDIQISANGYLELETVQRCARTRNGVRKFGFKHPLHYNQYFKLHNGAWVKRVPMSIVVLKPRKF